MILSEQKKKRAAEKAEDQKRIDLKNKLFAAMEKNTVTVNEKTLWADPKSEQNFAGRIRQMEMDGLNEIEWVQGTEVLQMTLDELKEVYSTGTKQIAALWDQYIKDLKALGGPE